MTATLIDSNEFVFADGNAGHICNFGSAPAAGQVDVLCVNSNTVVSTPSGFTADETAVNNQGAYVFARQAAGGESSSVTITTAGDHNTQVSWSRWAGLLAVDTATSSQANASVGGSTPAHSTGALAETGELIIAFGALHSTSTADQNTPVWAGGYTPLSEAVQGSGSAGVVGFVAYKDGVGTAAEAPSVSWSGNGAFDRYMLAVTFTTDGTEAHDGTAALGLALDVAGAGRKRVGGVGAVGVALDVAGAGRKKAHGVGALGLQLTVAAAGRKVGKGSGALTLALALSAGPPLAPYVPGRLVARARSSALTARGDSPSNVARGGYGDA